MRKQDMKPGVIYAYRESKYNAYQPIVVLDEKHMYWRMSSAAEKLADGAQRTFTLSTNKGITPGHGVGYLAAMDASYGGWSERKVDHMDPRRLLSITLERALALTFKRGSGKSADTLTFKSDGATVKIAVFNPRFIAGEWDDVMQAKDDEDERRRLIEEDLKRQSDARVAATKERVDRLAKLGLPGHLPEPHEPSSRPWRSSDWEPLRYDQHLTGKVSLTLGQLDALLSLIPEGAVYADPAEETEDDGWTLVRPPGQSSTTP